MNMLRVCSEFERDMISQRTREALAEKRRRVCPARHPSKLADSVVEPIGRVAYSGAPLRSIASALEDGGVLAGRRLGNLARQRNAPGPRRHPWSAVTAELQAADTDHSAA